MSKLATELALATEIAAGRKEVSESISLDFISSGFHAELASVIDKHGDELSEQILNKLLLEATNEARKLFYI